jgi:hypothetical protein
MSTRANIKITAEGEKPLWFYRHSDGYPEGALPTLNLFMDWLRKGLIRDNIDQAAGWLIVIGHKEYAGERYGPALFAPGDPATGMGWKVGAYEPTEGIHGDIEYLYTIDLTAKTLVIDEVGGGFGSPLTFKRIKSKLLPKASSLPKTPAARVAAVRAKVDATAK